MTLRSCLAAVCAAVLALGCSTDRSTAPTQTDAARAADEIEREASQLAVLAGPEAALTYHSAAAALRQGARVSTVKITVGTETADWYAFGHELVFTEPPGVTPVIEPLPMRALLAWRAGPAGTLQMIHLLAMGETGPIGRLAPIDVSSEPPQIFPSFLMYAESRDAFWQGVSGSQTSKRTSTGASCPAPPTRPVAAAPAPTCVEATFTFGFSGVEAQPFVVRRGASPSAAGTRTLSMAEQSVTGVQVTIPVPPEPFVNVGGPVAP